MSTNRPSPVIGFVSLYCLHHFVLLLKKATSVPIPVGESQEHGAEVKLRNRIVNVRYRSSARVIRHDLGGRSSAFTRSGTFQY